MTEAAGKSICELRKDSLEKNVFWIEAYNDQEMRTAILTLFLVFYVFYGLIANYHSLIFAS